MMVVHVNVNMLDGVTAFVVVTIVVMPDASAQ